MKKIIFFLFFIFFWLQYSFWFGKNGVYDFFRIRNSVDIEKLNILRIKLRIRNNQIFSEINDLINYREFAYEEHARSDLGMIKSGEIFYHLIVIEQDKNE